MPGLRMSILTKGLLLIALPILLQMGFMAVLFWGQSDITEAEGWAMHTQAVISQAKDVVRLIEEEHSRTRGAIVTGDPNFDVRPGQGVDTINREMDRLYDMVHDNPGQQAKLREARVHLEAFESWTRRQQELLASGNRAEAIEHVRDLSGKKTIDDLRTKLNGFLDEERRLGVERVGRVAQTQREQQRVLGAATIVSLVAAAMAAWMFSRNISSRVATLTRNAERLASGEPLAAPVRGRDEIAQLDQVLHRTAARLAEASALEERYKGQLEQRAAELARVNQDLQVKSQENELFIYSVSHDLRSPLVNLQGFSKELGRSCEDLREALAGHHVPETARKRLLTIVDEEMGVSLRFIQTAVSRSSAIIDALLRLSRAGRVEYLMQRVDVEAVVGRVVTAMSGSIRDKGAEVIVHGQLPPVWGDATAVEQVFGNLIGNAVSYLDSKRQGRVEVGMVPGDGGPGGQGKEGQNGSRTNGAMVTYFVKDNGLGIPAPYLAKMFMAFQRLHGNVAKGEGVGLALVRRMVERHGGRTWVESKEGEGTAFYVSLPAADGMPADPQAPVAQGAAGPAAGRAV